MRSEPAEVRSLAFEQTGHRFDQQRKRRTPPGSVSERTYITRNGCFIPNYGERWRYGEAIATGFVASTGNQVVSKRFCKK
jgi:hypothetical protein